MTLLIRPLVADDLPKFDQHFARHRAENGRNEAFFMPFATDDEDGPGGLDPALFELSLATPGWQRWWVALSAEGDSFVGHVDLKGDHLKAALHRCELGIGIESAYRGQGVGRRLMQVAIDFVRASPSIAWLDLRVFAHNTRARALYSDLGFTDLGTVFDRFRVASQSLDDVIMTLDVSG